MTTKEPKPTDSFMSYTKFIREELDRMLSTDEYKLVMKFYIAGIDVDKCIAKIVKGDY